MKNILLLALLLLNSTLLTAQSSCLPDGITFTTQQQVDNFPVDYPGCTVIEGSVIIGTNNDDNSINDLSGLSQLDTIAGFLSITHNASLENLYGLDHLTHIGEGLGIQYNDNIASLSGLEGINTIGAGLLISFNPSLENVLGLEGLDSIASTLAIGENEALLSLEGLDNLSYVGGNIYIQYNPVLSICAIEPICMHFADPENTPNSWVGDNGVGCKNTMELFEACNLIVEGDGCTDALDLNYLFLQESNIPQISNTFNNSYATTDITDPDFGWECFGEPNGTATSPSLERTLWFSFTGDGNTYYITTAFCNSTDYIDDGNTQMAIYSGDCDMLEAVACNDDGPDAQEEGPFPAGIEITTEVGIDYLMMIDGFGANLDAIGEFCVEVTNLSPSSSENKLSQNRFQLFPNPGSGLVNIEGGLANRVAVYDHTGRMINTYQMQSQQINLTHLPQGIYWLEIMKNEQIHIHKLIKK